MRRITAGASKHHCFMGKKEFPKLFKEYQIPNNLFVKL
jgi:hypothetical protein